MAASNLVCVWRQCKCATCRAVCSRCRSNIPFDVVDGCGTTECARWDPLSWEQYKEGLGWTGLASAVTEMDFVKARYGVTGPEFDKLYQEGVIKEIHGHLEFDTMVLHARVRQLRGDPKLYNLKESCTNFMQEGELHGNC